MTQNWGLWWLSVVLFAVAGLATVVIISVYGRTPVTFAALSLIYALMMIAGFATVIAAGGGGRDEYFTVLLLTAAPLSFLVCWAVFTLSDQRGMIMTAFAAIALNVVPAFDSIFFLNAEAAEFGNWLSYPKGALLIAAIIALALFRIRFRSDSSTAAPVRNQDPLQTLPDEAYAIVTNEAGAVISATPAGQKLFGVTDQVLSQGDCKIAFTPVSSGPLGPSSDNNKAVVSFYDHAGVKHHAYLRRKQLHDAANGGLEIVLIELIDDYVQQRASFNQLHGRIQSLIDANEDMLFFVSRSGLVLDINNAALQFLKKARNECEGEPISRLFPEEEQSASFKNWRDLLQAGEENAVKAEAVLRDYAGSKRLFHINISKVQGARDEDELLCAARDITDITQARKSFQAAQARLEQTVAERTKALNEAKKGSDKANISKSRFLANMSHELRTPLNAILGYTDLMKQDLVDTGKTDSQEYEDLERITVNARNLLTLINDVLDLSKVEANKMTLHYGEVDVHEFFREIQSSIEPLITKGGNVLNLDASDKPSSVIIDKQKLTQCLLNLLSNAAKFTEGGRISLKYWSEEKNDDQLLFFEVTDTGKGMTPEQCATVFDEFVQIEDHANGNAGGTGLGLPITKRFCQLMGGHIEAASAPGAGSRFTLWIKNGPKQHEQVKTPATEQIAQIEKQSV